MSKFKIGDRVRVINCLKGYSLYKDFIEKYGKNYISKWNAGQIPKNSDIGRVVAVGKHLNSVDEMAIVEINNNVFIMSFDGIEKIKENSTIVIHTKGNETIATLKQGKEVIKTAKARCNPKDEFNFKIGAKLAFDRLLGNDAIEVKLHMDTGVLRNAIKNLSESLAKALGNLVNKPSINVVKQEKYEVGDKVKVREDLKLYQHYGKLPCLQSHLNSDIMQTITNVTCEGNYNVDKSLMTYSAEMFEGKVIEESQSPKFDWNVLHNEDAEYIIIDEAKEENTINVGDTVEVVNAGSCYITYPRWFDDFAPKYSSRYSYGNSVKNGFIGKVVAKHKHHDYNTTVYAVQKGDCEVYLMGERGIKKICK